MDDLFISNNKELNYTEFRESINGMISKRDIVIDCDKFYLIKRNKAKIILLPKNFYEKLTLKDIIEHKNILKEHKRLCFQYVPELIYLDIKQQLKNEKVDIRNVFSLYSLMSYISPNFFDLKGKTFIELRETKNNIINNNKLYITDKCNLNTICDEVNLLIEEWNNSCGIKYRRTNHSGYDKNFFEKYYVCNPQNYYGMFFYDSNTDNKKLLGYSIISKQEKELNHSVCYSYLIRKCLSKTSNIRNLSLFIDYCSFLNISKNRNTDNHKSFYVHWGASSGNLLNYKRKFNVYKESKIRFFTIDTKDLLNDK